MLIPHNPPISVPYVTYLKGMKCYNCPINMRGAAMDYVNINDTLYTICEKYPETVEIFASRGFPQMADYEQRAGYGKLISLKLALEMKKLNQELFITLLNETIAAERESEDTSLGSNPSGLEAKGEKIKVSGLLPCPVRIPLLESFNRFAADYRKKHSLPVDAELKAASSGTGWVEEHVDNASSIDDLPDLFVSAGFDLFFDTRKIGRYRAAGDFTDLVPKRAVNRSFEGMGLSDPDKEYSIIAVVPAVFLVNRTELGDRPVPGSWEQLLSGAYEQSVSLPVGDFDLFNAMLLTLRHRYGDNAIRELGKVMLHSMHPSQMVKSHRMQNRRPAVTIMPYFFTRTVREGGAMEAVWPSDGAVLSPIFMLAKKGKAEQLAPFTDFFSSRDVGEILSHQGLFPSLHPEVDNRLPQDASFLWLGWDYIKEHDLSEEIAFCETLFQQSSPVSDAQEEAAV
jgi:ABC-type Fe3+ transport system substrate-binding protein